MATLAIHDRTGAEVGQYEIDPAQIAPRISKQLIHDAVVMYQNNLRLGTVRTKNRTDVAGTTKTTGAGGVIPSVSQTMTTHTTYSYR